MNKYKNTPDRKSPPSCLPAISLFVLAALLAPAQSHAAPPDRLLAGATAQADSVWPNPDKKFDGDKAIDGDNSTRWAAKAKTATLEITIGKTVTADTLIIREYGESRKFRVTDFTVEYYDGSEWLPLLSGKTIGNERNLPFAPVKMSKLRLKLTGSAPPSIYEVTLVDTKRTAPKSY